MADKSPTDKTAAKEVRTVCRVKCFYNGILYNPGDNGPVFAGSIPEDVKATATRAALFVEA